MLGHEYDLVIGGERLRTKEKIARSTRQDRHRWWASISRPIAEHAEQAIAAALKAFQTWQLVSPEQRTSLLLRAASLIRDRKFEFCAWLTYEVGKNWAEADADVAETIDFLEFYAAKHCGSPTLHRRSSIPASAISSSTSARRRRGYPAVEFSLRHHGGHDSRGHRLRQHRCLKPSTDAPTIAARFSMYSKRPACRRAS